MLSGGLTEQISKAWNRPGGVRLRYFRFGCSGMLGPFFYGRTAWRTWSWGCSVQNEIWPLANLQPIYLRFEERSIFVVPAEDLRGFCITKLPKYITDKLQKTPVTSLKCHVDQLLDYLFFWSGMYPFLASFGVWNNTRPISRACFSGPPGRRASKSNECFGCERWAHAKCSGLKNEHHAIYAWKDWLEWLCPEYKNREKYISCKGGNQCRI